MVIREIKRFADGGTKDAILTKIYESFKCISSTSVESKRAFSAAGSFSTKIRSRLNDDTLNALSSLRFYFQKPKTFSM